MLSVVDIITQSHEGAQGEQQDIVQDAIHAIRTHLGMDVAFLAEFKNGNRIYRKIDSDLKLPIAPGDAIPLEETYCQRVVDGRLPQLIPDTSLVPEAANLPVTKEFGLGAYLTAPIRMANGEIYGTLCCISFAPDLSLGKRDIAALNLFGDFVGRQLERSVSIRKTQEHIAEPIRNILVTKNFSTVYQPIYDLVQNKVAGFEALTRFASLPLRSPDLWFNDAAKVGLSKELEIAALVKALEGLVDFPQNVYMSLNVSPSNIINNAVLNVLSDVSLSRIVLEITEHDSVSDYDALAEALAPLRTKGLRVAVDDAGAGYASFRHILKLTPDIIKLDISITRNIDTQTSCRALASAVVRFSQETKCQVIAEGVETLAELNLLRDLGVHKVQGYFIGRPAPLDPALDMIESISLAG